nr:hypothetical protein [Bradyrhizobium sp.]
MTDFLQCRVELLLPASGNENVGALLGKTFGGGQADPCTAAGDQSDLSFKLFSHDVLLSDDSGKAARFAELNPSVRWWLWTRPDSIYP